jgi:hypothetical protein
VTLLAGPALPIVPAPPAAPSPPVANAEARWQPATVAGIAFAGAIVLNLGWIPGVVVSHWVPLLLVASGCMAALRIRRAGVRRALSSRASAKIAEFGGGVYGAMAMATLVQLETADLIGDVAGAGSLSRFIGSLDMEWAIAQLMESIGFAISAAMWPWHWFSGYGINAVLLALGACVGVDALLRFVSPRYRAHREEAEAAAAA